MCSLVQWCSVDEESGLRMDNRVSCRCFDIAALREGNELVVLDLRFQKARFRDVLFISCFVSVFTFIHPQRDNWELRKPLTGTFEHFISISFTPNDAFFIPICAFSIHTDCCFAYSKTYRNLNMTASLEDRNIPTPINGEADWHTNQYRMNDYVFVLFREVTSHMGSQWEWCLQDDIPCNDVMRRIPFNSWINY